MDNIGKQHICKSSVNKIYFNKYDYNVSYGGMRTFFVAF